MVPVALRRGAARPVARACAALALVAVLIVSAIGAPAAAADAGRRSPRAGAERPSLTLVQQPISVGVDDRFVVFLQVEGAPEDSELIVDIYDRVTDPDRVGADPEDSRATFDPIAVEGTRSGFAIDVYGPDSDRPDGPWAYEIDQAGVYPVRVMLRDGDGAVLSTLVTQLVRRPAPDEEVHQAAVAVVARVHQAPPADPDQRAAGDQVDDDFAERLDALDDVLRSHPTLPATFAVTPDTAARLAADRDQSEVLDGLRAVLEGRRRELLDAPYVDVDPAALVAHDLEPELTRQRDLGRRALTDALLQTPTSGIWSLSTRVDAGALAALRSRGIYRVLLPDTDFTTAPTLGPADLPAGDGQVRAVPVDRTFSLDEGGDDPVLAAHRLLARLAVAADEAPTDPGIVLPIDASTVDPLALPILFDGLVFGSPYWEATTVDQLYRRVGAAPSHPTLATPVPTDLGTYPETARRVHASVESLASMIVDQADVVAAFDRPLALSASEDLAPEDRRADLLAVEARVRRRLSAVSTPLRDKVTLGARDARFPLIITSKLDYPIQVVIDLEANDRLSFPDEHIDQVLQPGRTVAQIRVHTRASGDTPVRITVRTPDDRVILAESQYTIRSTAVSGVGVLLTIGAAGFLALWWGRHWYRSRRIPKHARRRRPRAGRPPAEVDLDAEDDDAVVAEGSPPLSTRRTGPERPQGASSDAPAM